MGWGDGVGGHHDSLRRSRSTRSVAALIAAATVCVLSIPTPALADELGCTPDPVWATLQTDPAAEVLRLVNAHRVSLGVAELQISPTLTRAAEWKAAHMAATNYVTHDDLGSPGRTWQQRFLDCGYLSSGNENIAWGYLSPADVVAGWLASPGHRAHIEDPNHVVTGTAVAVDAAGIISWVQDFGFAPDSSGGVTVIEPPDTTDTTGTTTTAPTTQPETTTTAPVTQPPTTTTAPATQPETTTTAPQTQTETDAPSDTTEPEADSDPAPAVEEANRAPLVVGEMRRPRVGSRIEISVLANDTDLDGDRLMVDAIVVWPRRAAAVSLGTDGTIVYRARRGTAGFRDRLTYRVADGNGGFAEGVILFRIRPRG